MNASACEGGKVHLLTEQAARCGVGKPPRHGRWQMELGEVTCRRCVRLRASDAIQAQLVTAACDQTPRSGQGGNGP